VVRGSEHYPQILECISDPPFVLFVRGDYRKLQRFGCGRGVAIVGSRAADRYGCEITRQAARSVVERGGIVVSGLAYGIDAAAHRGALEVKSDFPTAAI
jgi:DNA processing protein